ncbi:hypothetical protein FDP08_03485 [Marinobacter panjinensis]|uniref:Glycosyltransferase RgtA/B/C/D-like domain-containing protein n=1 Tax=Marinobacter panjinensis TaxID=2576384 RepID=A0A4U6R0T3_9GAMM|nr:hypothetical protein [Marinobacter panjinensis]MCR8915806.1 hypothetical protein [Marinobacter panjinensis]TKV67217.1 hypothetical protein FDP08_03485 [Marinobacter panjinensis]
MTQPDVSRAEWIGWAALLVASLAVNITFGIGYSITEGLWFDEALTTYFISLSWTDLGQFISRYEANMALYYGVLKLWGAISFSELWLRLFSLAAYAAAIWLFSRTLRDHFGARAVAAFVVLMLVHFFLVRFSVEIRGYALAMFFMALLWFSWVRICIEGNARFWRVYILAGALGIHSHFFVALGVFCLGILGLSRCRGQFGRWFLAHCLIALSFLPILAFVVFKESGQLSWIETPNIKSLIYLFFEFSGGSPEAGHIVRYTLVLLSMASLVAGFVGLAKKRGKGSDKAVSGQVLFWLAAAVACAGPVLLVFAVSQLEPVFAGRFFVPFIPFYLMLVAIGCTVYLRRFSIVPVMILAAASTVSAHNYNQREPNRWAEPYEFLSGHCQSGDAAVFLTPKGRSAVQFYDRQSENGCGVTPIPHELNADTYFVPADEYPEKLQELEKFNRVWFVLTHVTEKEAQLLTTYQSEVEQVIGTCTSAYQNSAVEILECAQSTPGEPQ